MFSVFVLFVGVVVAWLNPPLWRVGFSGHLCCGRLKLYPIWRGEPRHFIRAKMPGMFFNVTPCEGETLAIFSERLFFSFRRQSPPRSARKAAYLVCGRFSLLDLTNLVDLKQKTLANLSFDPFSHLFAPFGSKLGAFWSERFRPQFQPHPNPFMN